MASDTSDTNIVSTPGDALPTSADRLTADLAELRADLRAQTEGIRTGIRAEIGAQIGAQNEKFEQKFEVMFQEFMVRSNDTTNTVSAVEGRVKSIERAADTTHRHVETINDNLTRFDKRVEVIKHDMGVCEGIDADFQENQETLAARVETVGKNLSL